MSKDVEIFFKQRVFFFSEECQGNGELGGGGSPCKMTQSSEYVNWSRILSRIACPAYISMLIVKEVPIIALTWEGSQTVLLTSLPFIKH